MLCVCGFFFKSERERDRWVSSPLKASTNFSESIYIGASDEREKGGALSRNQSGHNKSSLNNFTYKSLFTITLLPSLYYYYYTHSFIHSPFHKHNLLHFALLLHSFSSHTQNSASKCSSLFTPPILERYFFSRFSNHPISKKDIFPSSFFIISCSFESLVIGVVALALWKLARLCCF